MKIARHLERGAWVYDDPEVHELALLWLLERGFNLADFDDWVERSVVAPARRQELLALRARAIEAERAGNAAAVESWLLCLQALQELDVRQKTMLPHVEADLHYRRNQAARAKLRSAALTPAAKKRMVQQYMDRVRNGQKYGAIKALARAFGVSERTVSSIVTPQRIRK